MSNGPTEPNRKENLIVLTSKKQEILDEVGQDDFEEFILLTHELHEAERRWREKREQIRAAINAGKPIEAGVHNAQIVTVKKLIIR